MPQNRRSHQLGEGHPQCAEMPCVCRPSRLVLGSQQDCTAMSPCDRSQGKGQAVDAFMSEGCRPSHQLGEGYQCGAEMPTWTHPPRLVLESQGSNAEMPMRDRSQGKGQSFGAAMPIDLRPSHQLGRGHE